MNKLSVLFFIFSALLSFNVQAQDCFEQTQPLPFSYCIYESAGSQNPDVLYYLHGINGQVKSWSEPTSFSHALYDLWEQNDQEAPTVVTFSFGPQWFLAQKNASPVSGLFEYTQAVVLPLLEQKMKHKTGKRMMMGISMGAVNTIQLGFKPQTSRVVELSKLAIICAQMSEVSPYSGEQALADYLRQTQVYRYYQSLNNTAVVEDRFYFAINVARKVWPKAEDFATADPLVLAKEFAPTHSTEVYVSAQVKDRYANFEANQVFKNILLNNQIPTTWQPVWGEHCDIDLKSLADFLIN